MNTGTESAHPEFNGPTAEQLALRAKRGCRRSFNELVELFHARLVRFLRKETAHPQSAEDIAQETFLRAWKNIGRYRSRWKFSTWLYTIGYHLACNHRADLPKGPANPSGQGKVQPPDVLAANRETSRMLWDTAAELPENQYEALWLKYAEDMSIKEIAKVMGKSQVNVKLILYRARTGLVKRLEPDIFEAGNTLLFGNAEGQKCGATFTNL
jgi:RNA polymerase sigma-70 factor (ECF subfamily)